MKTIKFNGCVECPYVAKVHCGKHLVCEHPSVMVAKPYANDRRIASDYPEFCPIPNVDFEVWTFEQFVEYGKIVSDNIVEGMPWSFKFKDYPVSHETNECYIITTPAASIDFKQGETMIVINGKIHDIYYSGVK